MEDFKIKVGVQLDTNAGAELQRQLNAMNLSVKVSNINIDSSKAISSGSNIGKQIGQTLKKGIDESAKGISLDNIFSANKTKSLQQINTYMAQNTKATKQFGQAMTDLRSKMANAMSTAELRQYRTEFMTLKSQVNELGLAGRSFGQEFGNIAGKFGSWIGVSTIVMSSIHSIQNAFGEIYKLDTALVDLKKTTNATSSELKAFYYEANDMAKSIGESTVAVINATSAWSRFGYSIRDATIMAKNSAILSSISPEMNIEEATDTYISSMKAFGIDAEDTLDEVASKINAIGNTQPVDNLDIAEMLKRSASAMAEANNSLDQTIALGTAGDSVVRNAESVGTAMKTISLRIRGYDEEVQSYTKDLANMGGDIADLTKTASTPGGLSIFTDEDRDTYKSTYEIFKDISEIYDQMSDKNQAALLEAVAGKFDFTRMCSNVHI